ncbi:Hypothetical_protein [Hexamita inflata]|uniref:Hypothetical_protein n=1 Tax=Hexamita inflata TaxID=28002 RepID=A0AA86TZP4_9EUKA|nr:Hypothetical protein HINF_LOCUS20702 [Hexamita inflata]
MSLWENKTNVFCLNITVKKFFTINILQRYWKQKTLFVQLTMITKKLFELMRIHLYFEHKQNDQQNYLIDTHRKMKGTQQQKFVKLKGFYPQKFQIQQISRTSVLDAQEFTLVVAVVLSG